MVAEVSRQPVLAAGAAYAGSGVLLGAFGAHALRGTLSDEALGWWQTGVQYQMWHGLALVALAAWPKAPRGAAWLLGLGAPIFSVSLYLMALSGLRWLGAVTPFGGLGMIAGWVWLAFWAWRGGSNRQAP